MIINNHKIMIKIINFENFEIIFWNQKPKTPSNGTCLGEPLGGFCVVVHFWCCVSSFIFICWCFSFCWCCISIWFSGYFAMSPALHSGFSDPWRPPPALSSTPATFHCLFFFIYCRRYRFEWVFFTHRCSLPYAPSWHVWQNLFLSRFSWELAVIPWNL